MSTGPLSQTWLDRENRYLFIFSKQTTIELHFQTKPENKICTILNWLWSIGLLWWIRESALWWRNILYHIEVPMLLLLAKYYILKFLHKIIFHSSSGLQVQRWTQTCCQSKQPEIMNSTQKLKKQMCNWSEKNIVELKTNIPYY